MPRLTPTSVRGLLKHLLYIRETWVKTHLSDDLSAITERAYHVWPTRLRGSFTLLKKKGVDSARRLKKSCKKKIKGRNTKETVSALPLTSMDDSNRQRCNSNLMVSKENCSDDMTSKLSTDHYETSDDEGVDVEGDLFFDPLDDPMNESDDESSMAQHEEDWVSFDGPLEVSVDSLQTSSRDLHSGRELPPIDELHQHKQQHIPQKQSLDTPPQVLEELPLPRMFIPGKIVHIYTHRGGYKAAFVPRKFRSLRRISMAGNMLSDHMSQVSCRPFSFVPLVINYHSEYILHTLLPVVL